jgi:hypothetical protein
MTGLIYPYQDHDEAAIALLPGVAAREPGGSYFARLTRPLATLDARYADAVEAFANIEGATGLSIDIVGQSVGEDRGGLADLEYRRIVAGRLVARWAGINTRSVARGWRALCGEQDITLIGERRSVILWSLIDWYPTSTFLRRAAMVVSDMIPADTTWHASMATRTTAIYGDTGTGYDVGSYAYELPNQGL